MAKLVPLNDNVVVKPVPKETMTASGIVIPNAGDEKPEEGEVVAVGPGKKNDDGSRTQMDLNVGEKVMFKKYAPDEFEIDGDKLLVLREDSIIAKVEE